MTKQDILAMNPGGKLDYWVDIYIFKTELGCPKCGFKKTVTAII